MIKIDCKKKKCLIRHEYREKEIVGLELSVEIKKKSEIEIIISGINSNCFYELSFLTFKIMAIIKEIDFSKKTRPIFVFVSCGKPIVNFLKESND